MKQFERGERERASKREERERESKREREGGGESRTSLCGFMVSSSRNNDIHVHATVSILMFNRTTDLLSL